MTTMTLVAMMLLTMPAKHNMKMPVHLLPLLVLPPPMIIMTMADDDDNANANDYDDDDDHDVIDG